MIQTGAHGTEDRPTQPFRSRLPVLEHEGVMAGEDRPDDRGALRGSVPQTAASATRAINLLMAQRLPAFVALVSVAFVARAIVAVVLHRILISRGGDGFIALDDRGYDTIAWQQAQAWHGIGPGVHPADHYLLNVYTYTQAAIYFVAGHHPLAMKLMNCLLGALAAGLILLIAWQLFGRLAGLFAGVAAAFFPSTFLWSVTGLKDTMFVFATALFLWLLTVLITTGSWRAVLPIFVAFAFVGGLRFYIQIMLGMLVPAAVMIQSRARLPQKWSMVVVIGGGCAALLFAGWVSQQLTFSAEMVSRQRYCAAVGAESDFVSTEEGQAEEECAQPVQPVEVEDSPTLVQSLEEMVAWFPTGLVYTLAAPFPWEADRMVERITIPEVFLWYGAVALALIGALSQWRSWRQYVHLLGYIAGILFLMALTQGNLGTLVRHRGMVIPFVLVFSGVGVAWLWAHCEARLPLFQSISSCGVTTQSRSET
jgi:hypothetical protein